MGDVTAVVKQTLRQLLAKQQYSAMTIFRTMGESGHLCANETNGRTQRLQMGTKPLKQQTLRAIKLQILLGWFCTVNWVQRICCDLL